MSVRKMLCFAVFNFWLVFVCNAEVDYFNSENWSDQEYVDPHSLYYNKQTHEENLPPVDNDDREVGEYNNCGECYKQLQNCRKVHNADIADELMSRRFINMLMSRAKWEKSSLNFVGSIDLYGTKADIEALRNFGLGKLKLREIDPILNKILLTPQYDSTYESASNINGIMAKITSAVWIALITVTSIMLENKEITIGTLSALSFCYFLKGSRFNFAYKLLICIFAISYLVTWWKLVQDAQIKHTAAQMENMEMSIYCQPDKMNWYHHVLKKILHTDQCEKYVAAVMREPLYQVSPAQVISHMLAVFIYEPFTQSGKAISVFLANVTEHMPWPLSWSIQAAFILTFVPVIILLVILLLGGTLSIGPFSILSLRGPRPSAPRQSEKERQPIEVMLNITSNLQLPPSFTHDVVRSNNPAIAACPGGCAESKKENSSPPKAITCDKKAGGDAESTTKPGSSNESDDAESEPGVRKVKITESGSGDSNFTFL